MLTEKMQYTVLEIYAKRVRELVLNKKYKNSDDFVKSAIEILLTWESKHPEEIFQAIKTLMPFTPEQEAFMKMSMDPEVLKNEFGGLEIDDELDESKKQKVLAQTSDDHLKIRDNFHLSKTYIKSLKISKPKQTVPYDGYPLLSGFYSRLLPAKIAITVLGHLLERKKSTKVELTELRVNAYDIAEEISETLSSYERDHDVARNQKMSTGLPKKGHEDHDEEKKLMATKRFKDQFVGKVRKSRITKTNHFEGALSALGLVYATQEDDKTFVSLTEEGKEFFLLENPIVQGEYEKGPLTKQESEFILKKLIPQRKLEKRFVDTAVAIIKKIPPGEKTLEGSEKITNVLDTEFFEAARKYIDENRDVAKLYNLNQLNSQNEIVKKKIIQWRLATMGRLSEMKIVNWTINDKGDSEYSLN